jgi:cyclic pyranopterin phosphate synthase
MQSVSDGYGRRFSGLRISVTQRCNLSCPHCHREGQVRSAGEMRPDEIGRITSVAASLGASKVKMTGGEPLMREDICDIVSAIRPHVKEISMTTNGIGLEESACELKKAGLDRVNISIHSLSREKLKEISGNDYLDEFKRGLEAADSCGLKPIKLNMVILKGVNEGEIWEMAEFASRYGAILQLIELASDRTGCNKEFFMNHHFPLKDIEAYLSANASDISFNELHRRGRYVVEKAGKPTSIEIVRSMHNTTFCANCGRLRLSSDGMLKGCLFDNEGSVDILGVLRSGASQEAMSEMFIKSIKQRKPYWN